MPQRRNTRRSQLLCTISALVFFGASAGAAFAQDAEVQELVVTATRREAQVQDVPLNISAVGGDTIEQLNIKNLAQLSATVPGVHIVSQGGRTSDRIVVRGLNVDQLNQTDTARNTSGGIVATYLGDIPDYLDLKLNDMQRVEFLLGPQGTLYGAGTMGGAIRYIPNRPVLGKFEGELRSDVYGYNHAKDKSIDYGGTVNIPLGETLALRASVDYLHDSGFIDYDYVVAHPGVTNPNIVDPSAPGYDLKQYPDANGEETVSGRVGLRWKPNDRIDANLTYYYQDEKSEGRTISNWRSQILPTGKYETSLRYLEPNRRKNDLLALEVTADLGFAELTSATGYSRFREKGQRDQTNLLIGLEYSYEAFPSFSAYTFDTDDQKNFTQELRLVSKTGGPFSWIIGGFYNRFKLNDSSYEFTPGYSEYMVNVVGTGGAIRPDEIEYYAPGSKKLEEKAVFGEVSYQLTDKWQITGGARYYGYNLVTSDGVDFPLLYTSITPDGRQPSDIDVVYSPNGQKDHGWLFKFNTSYKVTDDVMAYFTFSQGYRPGNGNDVSPCPQPLGNFQNVCGLPDELSYKPDKTSNYELGAKTQWFDRRLTLNASVYYIDWKNPQLASATVNGASPIFRNGKGAETKGFDISFSGKVTDELTVSGSYAYTVAKLTAFAPNVVTSVVDPALAGPDDTPFGAVQIDGQKGDRLPGSPKNQFNLFIDYAHPVANGWTFKVDYNVQAISNVFSRIGDRGGAIPLPGYAVHNLSVGFDHGDWTFALYANNLFDKFAETGVTGTPFYDKAVTDANGGPVYYRGYFTNVIAPRKVGLRITAKFGG